MTIQRTLPDLAAEMNTEHDAFLASASDAIARAIKLGGMLTEAKGQLSHGEWIPWGEANLKFNRSQAWKYMRAYDRREMFSPTEHFGGLEGFIKSLAEPRPTLDPPPEASWIPATAADPPCPDPVVHVTKAIRQAPMPAVARPIPTI